MAAAQAVEPVEPSAPVTPVTPREPMAPAELAGPSEPAEPNEPTAVEPTAVEPSVVEPSVAHAHTGTNVGTLDARFIDGEGRPKWEVLAALPVSGPQTLDFSHALDALCNGWQGDAAVLIESRNREGGKYYVPSERIAPAHHLTTSPPSSLSTN